VDPFSSALDVAAAIRRKEVSPSEVVDLYLERADRLDPQLNAFAFRDDDRVREAARRATDTVASSPADDLGPFHGVPIPIKDLNDVAGWPTSHGSKGASKEPMAESELVVERFEEAGFVLCNKTATPEFGAVSFTESDALGVTRNPWNTDHTPGGSSGGAAAAVASGMAPIAHASDGGGSIRIPSSCCGLVGLKPSRNRVPSGPNSLEGLSSSGVVSRTIADSAAVLDIIGRPDPLSWYNAPPPAESFAASSVRPPSALRIGLVTTPPVELAVDQACLDAVEATAKLLESLGHTVAEFDLGIDDVDRFVSAFGAIWNTGMAGVPLADPDAVEPHNRAMHADALATDSIAYVESVMLTQTLTRELVAPFGRDIDVMLTPTMAVEPPRCGAVWEGADTEPLMAVLNCYPMAAFTTPWNVTGLPALSLPLHQAPSGLPVGVQFIAGPWQEATLLRLGAQLEAAQPWIDRRPAVGG
jgi:amidase